ncbi:ATP-binding cassette domain-containing protein [Desulfovibrio litoralis]|uniref:Peptide/nickel transport system ATP-binding protein n=1 Tax=Desulfovibrio litoralis DSM 11393 TaxID=1121455 RepID=A0A1M7SAD9_9BACT|nr:ATP-binding cassette domain-containing protein [Desulfovibrio litoralis]SHN55557.1 peptide/nickel transport system ATP-binding protein [Desulfovibrio litoralis DSM 11393]
MDIPLLELKNVCKSFKLNTGVFSAPLEIKAVDKVSFSLEKGKTLALVGESGCGKSTLARIISRLIYPDSGEILFYGQNIHNKDARFQTDLYRCIQMIFQDPFSSLNPRLSIGASIVEPLENLAKQNTVFGEKWRDKKTRHARVEEMLSLVGLMPEHALRYPHEFSGGQRQRIAIARALICSPELVICDEPVSSLDVSVQAQVLNLLMDLQDRFSTSYLFITHDLNLIGHISDRVAVMKQGRIVEMGNSLDILKHPEHEYTRLLLQNAV